MKVLIILAILLSLSGCRILNQGGGGCQAFTVQQVINELQEGDDILLVIGTDWCPACKTLERKLQVNSDVKQAIQDRFGKHVYAIDAESLIHRKLVNRLNVSAYPTVVRMKFKNGKPVEVARFVGAGLSYGEMVEFISKEYE